MGETSESVKQEHGNWYFCLRRSCFSPPTQSYELCSKTFPKTKKERSNVGRMSNRKQSCHAFLSGCAFSMTSKDDPKSTIAARPSEEINNSSEIRRK